MDSIVTSCSHHANNLPFTHVFQSSWIWSMYWGLLTLPLISTCNCGDYHILMSPNCQYQWIVSICSQYITCVHSNSHRVCFQELEWSLPWSHFLPSLTFPCLPIVTICLSYCCLQFVDTPWQLFHEKCKKYMNSFCIYFAELIENGIQMMLDLWMVNLGNSSEASSYYPEMIWLASSRLQLLERNGKNNLLFCIFIKMLPWFSLESCFVIIFH